MSHRFSQSLMSFKKHNKINREIEYIRLGVWAFALFRIFTLKLIETRLSKKKTHEARIFNDIYFSWIHLVWWHQAFDEIFLHHQMLIFRFRSIRISQCLRRWKLRGCFIWYTFIALFTELHNCAIVYVFTCYAVSCSSSKSEPFVS